MDRILNFSRSLHIPLDKASLMQVIDSAEDQETESAVLTVPKSQPIPMVLDSMGVLHSIKNIKYVGNNGS